MGIGPIMISVALEKWREGEEREMCILTWQYFGSIWCVNENWLDKKSRFGMLNLLLQDQDSKIQEIIIRATILLLEISRWTLHWGNCTNPKVKRKKKKKKGNPKSQQLKHLFSTDLWRIFTILETITLKNNWKYNSTFKICTEMISYH